MVPFLKRNRDQFVEIGTIHFDLGDVIDPVRAVTHARHGGRVRHSPREIQKKPD
jgi:hypothetical protein